MAFTTLVIGAVLGIVFGFSAGGWVLAAWLDRKQRYALAMWCYRLTGILQAQPPYRITAYAYSAISKMDMGRVEEGLEECRSLLTSLHQYVNPEVEAAVRNAMGWSLCNSGRCEEAEREFRQAAVLVGSSEELDVHVRMGLAVVMETDCRYQQALTICETVLGRSYNVDYAHAWARGVRGSALIGLGSLDEGLDDLETADRLSATSRRWGPFIRYNGNAFRARAYLLRANWEAALTCAEGALSEARNPADRAIDLLQRARALIGLGRLSEAETEWRLAQFAASSVRVQVESLIVAGLIAEAGTAIDDAVKNYAKAVELSTHDAEPRYRAGRLLAPMSPDDSQRWFAQAVQVNPESHFGRLARVELK